MYKIPVKPMSTNEAWKGQRHKTTKYKKYESVVPLMLPKITIPKGKLKILYEFGFSSRGSDYDNAIKQIQDIISKHYMFNDNRIYRAEIDKVIVPKGKEYVKFNIVKLEE